MDIFEEVSHNFDQFVHILGQFVHNLERQQQQELLLLGVVGCLARRVTSHRIICCLTNSNNQIDRSFHKDHFSGSSSSWQFFSSSLVTFSLTSMCPAAPRADISFFTVAPSPTVSNWEGDDYLSLFCQIGTYFHISFEF